MMYSYFPIALTVFLMSSDPLKADDTRTESRDIKKEKLLSRIKRSPSYVRNTNYDKKWFNVLRTGIDTTREYLGNYGPLHVYIIGQESKELEDEAVKDAIIKAFCHCRHAQTKDRILGCLKGAGASLIKRARNNSTEAYLSYVDYTEPPLAELIFINPHGFDVPYLYTRGIHEYTHVFQRGFPGTPTWMTEGSAEFLAFYLGSKNEWINFERSMEESMRMVQSVEDDVSLVDFEDIEKIEKDENIKINEKAKEALFNISEGDARKINNILQSSAAVSKDITEEVIYSMASFARPKEVDEVLKLALANKFVDARNKLMDIMLNYGLSGLDIIKQIQQEILNLDLANEKKMLLMEKCGEIEFRMTEGSDEFIQLEALLSQFVLYGSK